MEYRYLGNSGLQVSTLSFGAWVTFGHQMDTGLAHECMRKAYDAGVNFFDNAEVYAGGQAEEIMGKILKDAAWSRDSYVVSTKIFWGGDGPNQRGLSRKHIVEGTNNALKRLQLDYVDLLFCHRPDLHTPVEETVFAMNHLIAQGKALYWGTSEWSAARIMEAHGIAKANGLIGPLMEQPQYNMFCRERVEAEYADLYRVMGLGLTIWSPLASGLLTGKYNVGAPKDTRAHLPGYEWLRKKLEGEGAAEKIKKVQALEPVANDLECTLAQLALAWCAKNPRVSTVITGASKPAQVEENMRALEVLPKLNHEVMERIEAILDNAPKAELDFR